jgi:two-component system, NarL family, sensor histidine kinase DesK
VDPVNAQEPHAARPSGQFPTTAPGHAPAADAGASGASAGAARTGRGVRATWWYTFSSMASFAVAMAFVVLAVQSNLVAESGGTRTPLLTVVDLLVVLSGATALYGCFLLRHGLGQGWPGWRNTLLVCVPPAMVWTLTLWMPGAAITGTFMVWMAANVIAPLLTGASRRAVLAAGLALFALHWWAGERITGVALVGLETGPELFSLLFFAAMCPLIFLFSAWWWNIVVQLDAARRDAAQLAVARERLRFASDLHDIQGHHLQVIALKAELAERLLDAGRPEDARGHIHEVRTLARTALEETRSLVRDLREVSLEEEIANAKDVLEAAGAAVSVRGALVEDPAARTLLGLAVREGTTNVLRHATSATRVAIALEAGNGRVGLVMTNDDAGPAAGDGAGAPDGAGPSSGTGLAGLNRRFAASGGSVAGRREAGSFILEARLPMAPDRPGGPFRRQDHRDQHTDRHHTDRHQGKTA